MEKEEERKLNERKSKQREIDDDDIEGQKKKDLDLFS